MMVAAVLMPGGATLLALLPGEISTTSAALAYVLAVMAAAAAGGLVAGLIASALSFLVLNFFFTEPLRTFRVNKGEDIVALLVFLAVSVVVASLLSVTIEQRARAERREGDARLLQNIGTRLLAGRPVQEVLRDFAGLVVHRFGLARCEILIDGESPVVVEDSAPGAFGEPSVVPILAGDRAIGQIEALPRSSRLSGEEEAVLRAFAAEVALAFEGARLSAEAGRARTDAETSRMRAALFSSVTHDLRTPLASITASVTNLLDPGANLEEPGRRELLETIHQEADRLNRLVGNLLHLARMRAGAVEPVKRAMSVNDVVEGVVARLQRLFEAREVRLLFREDLPEVAMDGDQIDQVLTNLLENAAQFSRKGSPITVSTARWHDAVQVRVADHGSGIPATDRERVFEPFVRRDGSGDRGTGLGLSIARALVEAHGGKIWIEGTPGGGTTVIFELPAQE